MPLTWHAWAPPLDPPTAGGLPEDQAASIAAAYWAADPHECAAILWEAYAAGLPPQPVVSQVATGSQSVSYSPPVPGGDYGVAITRANWHRSLAGSLHAPELAADSPVAVPRDGGWEPVQYGGRWW